MFAVLKNYLIVLNIFKIRNTLHIMKRITLILALIVFAVSINSCASKKKGCGLTADNQKATQQEIVVAEVTE